MLNFVDDANFEYIYIDDEGSLYKGYQENEPVLLSIRARQRVFLEMVTLNRITYLKGAEGPSHEPMYFKIRDSDGEV